MIVSFIVPIYNTPEELLRKGLDVFVQNRTEGMEVILVDDGSDKNVAEIIDDYGNKSDLFRVFHQENQGVSVARNVGIENSMAKYIVFVDPDDYVLPDVMDMSFFENNDSDVILFGFVRKDCNGCENKIIIEEKNNIVSREELIKNVLFCKNIYGDYYAGAIWAKAFNRQFIKENNIFFDKELKKAQDRLFMLEIYNYAKNIMLSGKCTYVYFENLLSICNAYKPGSSIRSELFANAVQEYIKKMSWFDKSDMVIAKTYFEMYFEMLYLDIFNISNLDSYKTKRKIAVEKYNTLNMFEKMREFSIFDCVNRTELIKCVLIKYKMIDILYLMIKYRQKKRRKI